MKISPFNGEDDAEHNRLGLWRQYNCDVGGFFFGTESFERVKNDWPDATVCSLEENLAVY